MAPVKKTTKKPAVKKAAVKHKAVAKPKPVVKEEEILVEIAPVEVAEVANGNGKEKYFQAIKHGIARALVEFDLNFRKKLKKSGFLTRDSRIKERRKYGHKKARKMGQFSKR